MKSAPHPLWSHTRLVMSTITCALSAVTWAVSTLRKERLVQHFDLNERAWPLDLTLWTSNLPLPVWSDGAAAICAVQYIAAMALYTTQLYNSPLKCCTQIQKWCIIIETATGYNCAIVVSSVYTCLCTLLGISWLHYCGQLLQQVCTVDNIQSKHHRLQEMLGGSLLV